jgi:hypothetical protein
MHRSSISSNIFDTGWSQDVWKTQNTQALNSEFIEYLKGRFDYKSVSNYPASCGGFGTAGEASASKEAFELKVRQGAKQIVEVIWNYTPDEAGFRLYPFHESDDR